MLQIPVGRHHHAEQRRFGAWSGSLLPLPPLTLELTAVLCTQCSRRPRRMSAPISAAAPIGTRSLMALLLLDLLRRERSDELALPIHCAALRGAAGNTGPLRFCAQDMGAGCAPTNASVLSTVFYVALCSVNYEL